MSSLNRINYPEHTSEKFHPIKVQLQVSNPLKWKTIPKTSFTISIHVNNNGIHSFKKEMMSKEKKLNKWLRIFSFLPHFLSQHALLWEFKHDIWKFAQFSSLFPGCVFIHFLLLLFFFGCTQNDISMLACLLHLEKCL